jgi:hypothetical protein
VRAFLDRGAQVAFVARGRDRVERVVRALPGAHGIVGDVSVKEEIHPIAIQILGELGGLDVLVNNASELGPTPLALLADTECEELERALASKAALRHMTSIWDAELAAEGGAVLLARSGRHGHAAPPPGGARRGPGDVEASRSGRARIDRRDRRGASSRERRVVIAAADRPTEPRVPAKLLIVDAHGRLTHASLDLVIDCLRSGDLVVANDAATLPASLQGSHVPSGRAVEVRLAGRRSLARDDVREFAAIVFGEGDFHIRGPGVANQRIGATTRLRIVDAILTGVHEPGTSRYELMRAFADDRALSRAQEEMSAHGYRTHEFGDSLLIEAGSSETRTPTVRLRKHMARRERAGQRPVESGCGDAACVAPHVVPLQPRGWRPPSAETRTSRAGWSGDVRTDQFEHELISARNRANATRRVVAAS